MNKIILIGNIGKDLELQGTTSGKTYVKFSLAVKDRFNKDHTNWINCVAWNKTAEVMSQYLGKGSKIAVEGRIQTGSYEKEGRKVYTTDVIVENFDFLETRAEKQEYNAPVEESEPILDIASDLPF